MDTSHTSHLKTLEWKELETNFSPLRSALNTLQERLRFVHRRKVVWEANDSGIAVLPPDKYLVALLQPIPGLFNQLHSREFVKSLSHTPMSCTMLDYKVPGVFGASFACKEFDETRVAPQVLLSPFTLFDPQGRVSAQTQHILAESLEKAAFRSIIVSNFNEMAVFYPPTASRTDSTFERVITDQPALTLRVLATAFVLRTQPCFIDIPDPLPEPDDSLVLPEGPSLDPAQPLSSDEEVFATHKRHSDFDGCTLVRDEQRARQFFRWQQYISQQSEKVVAAPNDLLVGFTHKIGQTLPMTRPIYPFEETEITPETRAHIDAIQRPSPLDHAGIENTFQESKSFTLIVEDVIAKGSERGICTVYRCRIASIDGELISSPPLCLKLFDDRFQVLPTEAEDPEYFEDPVVRWFDRVVVAECVAMNEAFAYDKLKPLQGSLVPWFFGMHQFTLPNGTVLYGLLMEYIDGHLLNSEYTHNLTRDRQLSIIQSGRHGARALDAADVVQLDWHVDQVLVTTSQDGQDHVVLIDFAATVQTWDPDVLISPDSYFHMFRILYKGEGNKGLDRDLVWENYGEPDDRDPVFAIFPRTLRSEEKRILKARDMFPYIRI
ncbi:hypothetical protein BT69DRAFT_1277185 [Atractiella rhizophila]|nr:hypothetical protein BT69DRAFT_1277185 [Atractiella rhizophila]